MTKLAEWVTCAVLFLAPWLAVVTRQYTSPALESHYISILLLPLLLVALFGVVSVAIIAYRVATFNDCIAANDELQKQILQAKRELSAKGVTFSQETS